MNGPAGAPLSINLANAKIAANAEGNCMSEARYIAAHVVITAPGQIAERFKSKNVKPSMRPLEANDESPTVISLGKSVPF